MKPLCTGRLAVYPFDESFLPFCDAPLEGPELAHLVAPGGFGFEGQDVAQLDRRDPTGRSLTHDFDAALADCDALLFLGGDPPPRLKQDILDKMLAAARAGKAIFSSLELKAEEEASLMEACARHGTPFTNLTQPSLPSFDSTKPKRLLQPQASVVFVGELIERANSLDVTLALHAYLKRQGYKVCTVAVPWEARLFGLHTQAEFLSQQALPEHQKIDALYHRVMEIDQAETPDVILVQLPGGMMRFDNIETSQHGVYAYLWSQAVTPDCFVLCAPYLLFDPAKAAEVSQVFRHRYGFGIDCLHMSNTLMDFEHHATYFASRWSHQPVAEVVEYLESSRACGYLPSYCALSRPQREALCALVEQVLQNLSSAQSI